MYSVTVRVCREWCIVGWNKMPAKRRRRQARVEAASQPMAERGMQQRGGVYPDPFFLFFFTSSLPSCLLYKSKQIAAAALKPSGSPLLLAHFCLNGTRFFISARCNWKVSLAAFEWSTSTFFGIRIYTFTHFHCQDVNIPLACLWRANTRVVNLPFLTQMSFLH